jgi:transglutaminase-like putative cysteine protease
MGRVERFFEFSLLGLLTSGFLALVGSGYLDLPTTFLTGAGLILRALLVAGVVRFQFSANWINAITLLYIGFYPLDYLYGSREFIPATVHLICYLAVLRVLSARTNRDYFFVKIIAFLELLAASILSANLSFFIFLAFFLIFGVATFSSSEIRRSSQLPARQIRGTQNMSHWRLATLTGVTAAGILVLTGGLFFLLPRTARAAFQHLVPQRYHLPGFSNEVTLGQIGEIQSQSNTVMHIRVEGPEKPLALKWRGAAMGDFDGRRWFNRPSSGQILRVANGLVSLNERKQTRRSGPYISYEVNVKAIDSDVLFFTGVPEFLRTELPLVFRTPTDAFRTGVGVTDGMHYFGYSHMVESDDVPLSPPLRTTYLRLPQYDPKIALLAGDVTAGLRSDLERAKALERHLRSNYGYTLQLLNEPVADPLGHFLFVRRQGHCEYFASAMAVMLRTLSIPSRVVTGFQSGTFNPMTGWHIIRGSDAHSWVEAYLPDHGWVTFDPTPPSRNPKLAGVFSRLMLYVDAAETFWDEWVLNYNLERQLNLAAHVDSTTRRARANWFERFTKWAHSDFDLKTLKRSLAIGSGLLAIAVALFLYGPACWRWWLTHLRVKRIRRGRVGASDASILYGRMLAILKRRGFEKPAWLTPIEFARILPDPRTAAMVEDLTGAYNELRFGGKPDAGLKMLALLKDLEAGA